MKPHHRRRQAEIAEVLVRYEMGHLLQLLGLEGLVSVERQLLHRGPARTRPENLRLALAELGPTFIKLGQVLSTRADLLPRDFQEELAKLQDNGPTVAADVIESVIAAELGTGTEVAFASFDPEPLAGASIGQVHAATLHDGTEVVVKVRRPGTAEEVELDLDILQNFAARASQRWEEAKHCDLEGLARDFARTLRAELDYLEEASHAQVFADNFAAIADVRIPAILPDLTTTRVLTMERLRGLKISDLAGLELAGVDRSALAQRLIRAVTKMVFDDGYYHADPHPGNFFVESTGRIGIVDFGRVGILGDETRSLLGRLLLALLDRDPERLTNALVALKMHSVRVDRARLRQDLVSLLAGYGGQNLREVSIGAAITEVMDIVRRHDLVIAPDLALLFAVLVMDESIAEQLDPQFRLEEVVTSSIRDHLTSSLAPAALAHRVEAFGTEVVELMAGMPGQLRRLLEMVADGQLNVHVRTDELEEIVHRFERLGNRVAMSILAAAVIDGLSELAAHQRVRRDWRRPVLAAGLAALSSAGGYLALRQSRLSSVLARTGRPT